MAGVVLVHVLAAWPEVVRQVFPAADVRDPDGRRCGAAGRGRVLDGHAEDMQEREDGAALRCDSS